jgi:hypothetical protein
MFDFRRSAANAIVVLAVLVGLSALLWDSGSHRISSFVVGALLAVAGLAGRSYVRGVFHVATAAAIWLFVSPWVLPGGSSGTVVANTVLGALVFGFAGAAIADGVGKRTEPDVT